MSFNFWEILLIFSAFQGLYLSYMVLVHPKQNINIWLLSLLLLNAFLLIDYVLYFSGIHREIPHLQNISGPFWFLLGPLFYFFIHKYIYGKEPKFLYYHFIPFFIILILTIPFYLLDAHVKSKLYTPIEKVNYEDLSYSWILYALHFSCYLYISVKMLLKIVKSAKLELSDSSLEHFKLPIRATYIMCLYIFTYFLMAPILATNNIYFMEFDFLNVLILAILNYTIAFSTLRFSIPSFPKKKYETSALKSEDLEFIQKKVISLIEIEKLYTNPELKIQYISEKLSIPRHQISQMFNQKLQSSFYDVINHYRIEEIKKRFQKNDHQKQTMLSLAFDAGFNSQASFYRIFKQKEGKTPTQYVKMFHEIN